MAADGSSQALSHVNTLTPRLYQSSRVSGRFHRTQHSPTVRSREGVASLLFRRRQRGCKYVTPPSPFAAAIY